MSFFLPGIMKQFVMGISQRLLPHFRPIESYCVTIFRPFVQIDKLIRAERQSNDGDTVINRLNKIMLQRRDLKTVPWTYT